MEFKATGKIIEIGAERSGTSARGIWKSQEFVIETHEQYTRKMVFEVFGEDRLSKFNLQVNQEVDVYFSIDAREYNGRWFNSIRAYDVRQVGAVPPIPVTVHNADGTTERQDMPFPPTDNSNLGF